MDEAVVRGLASGGAIPGKVFKVMLGTTAGFFTPTNTLCHP